MNLKSQYENFITLPINAVLPALFTKNAVTMNEKREIENTEKNNLDGMKTFVDMVLLSLSKDHSHQYIAFREVMENSDNTLLQEMASRLSKYSVLYYAWFLLQHLFLVDMCIIL